MQTLLLYTLVATAAYYLSNFATVTRFLWSRYPAPLAHFLGCASCSGFWWGILCGLAGRALHLPLLGLDPAAWSTPVAAGLCALVTTPLGAWALGAAHAHLAPPEDPNA
jgi:hypothetical protein